MRRAGDAGDGSTTSRGWSRLARLFVLTAAVAALIIAWDDTGVVGNGLSSTTDVTTIRAQGSEVSASVSAPASVSEQHNTLHEAPGGGLDALNASSRSAHQPRSGPYANASANADPDPNPDRMVPSGPTTNATTLVSMGPATGGADGALVGAPAPMLFSNSSETEAQAQAEAHAEVPQAEPEHGTMAEYDALGPPESANSPTSDSPADMGLLADHLGLTWNDTTDFSRVTVLSASAGTWPPPFRHDNVTPGAESGAESAPCTTPKLWLFLYGHYRSFDTTQASIKAMADESTGGCYMVVAVMPERLDGGKFAGGSARSQLSASTLLNDTVFGGRLAYAVVARAGVIDVRPNFYAMYFHAVWGVAQWAGRHHGIRIDRHSVVIRTRPDVFFERPLDLAHATDYFRRGERGRHLVLGQEWDNTQGDILMLTSWSAYETDIARPFEEAQRRRRSGELAAARFFLDLALTNGWAYGRSISNRAPWEGMEGMLGACVCLDGTTTCGEGETACLMTVVESGATFPTARIVRVNPVGNGRTFQGGGAAVIHYDNSTGPLDVAVVHVYCPGGAEQAAGAPAGYAFMSKGYYRHDKNYMTRGGQGVYRAIQSTRLPLPEDDALAVGGSNEGAAGGSVEGAVDGSVGGDVGSTALSEGGLWSSPACQAAAGAAYSERPAELVPKRSRRRRERRRY